MLLMVSTKVWDLLVVQADAEGRSPGDVVVDALCRYIEAPHGCEEARAILEKAGWQALATQDVRR